MAVRQECGSSSANLCFASHPQHRDVGRLLRKRAVVPLRAPFTGSLHAQRATCLASEKPAICFYSMLRCPCRCPCGFMHAVQWCARYTDIQTHVCTHTRTTLHALVHKRLSAKVFAFAPWTSGIEACRCTSATHLLRAEVLGTAGFRALFEAFMGSKTPPGRSVITVHNGARFRTLSTKRCSTTQISKQCMPICARLPTFGALCATTNYILWHVLGPTCIRVCAVFARRS